MSIVKQDNYPDHSTASPHQSNNHYNTRISGRHRADCTTTFHPSLHSTISSHSNAVVDASSSSTTCQVQHPANNNLSLELKHCDNCKQASAALASTASRAQSDNMGGVVSSVTSMLCGVTRTGNSDEVYIKSSQINGLNGHYQNNDLNCSENQKQLPNRRLPVEEDFISPPANDYTEDYYKSPAAAADTNNHHCDRQPLLAAETSLDIPFADESSSQESTPRCQHKSNHLQNGYINSGNYVYASNRHVDTALPNHRSLDASVTNDKQVLPNHSNITPGQRDLRVVRDNTDSVVEGEVIEISEAEVSADEEQESAEEEEEDSEEDGELERVESSDNEVADSGDEEVHYCDSDCDHSDEEEAIIEEESEGASDVEDDDEIHECDSNCEHSEYDDNESEADSELVESEVEDSDEDGDEVVEISEDDRSQDEEQCSDDEDAECEVYECTSDCGSDCDGNHHECSSECGCNIDQSVESEYEETREADSDDDLDGSDYEQSFVNNLANGDVERNSHHQDADDNSLELPSTDSSVKPSHERNNNRIQRNNSHRQLQRSSTAEMMGELKTAIDARVRRTASCRETSTDYRKKYLTRNEPDITEHSSKLDVKERETRRKDRRSRLRTLELKREQFLDELRGGAEDNVIDRVYNEDINTTNS